MTRAGLACLAAALLLGLANEAAAGSRRSAEEERLAALWTEYQDIRKVRDVAENRRRTRIARELAEIGSDDSRKRLLEIFEKDPDPRPRLAAMLALCARGDARLVSRVVRKAAGEGGALGLWIGDALRGATSAEIGPWLAGPSRLLTNGRTRLAAIEALGHLRVPEAREPLLGLLKKHGRSKNHGDLLFEVLRALGRIGGEGVTEALLEAAAHGDARRRLAAAEALLEPEADQAAIDAMRNLLADENGLVREVAARSAGARKVEALVPGLLPLLEDDRLRVRAVARGALRAIAETDLGHDREEWRRWWDRRQAGEKAGLATVARSEDDRIMSSGVLVLIDVSKSMGWQAPSVTTRLSVAKEKVVALLDRLDERSVFNVVAVCGKPRPFRKAKGRRGAEIPATAKNVEAAKAWVEGLECAVHTNFWDCLEEALARRPEIDTIFLVTDGAVGLGGYVPPEEILPRFRELNRFRRVVVHASFLMWPPRMSWAEKYEDPDEQAAFLRALAEQTGGTFEQMLIPPER